LQNNKINSLIDARRELSSLRRSKPSHESFNFDGKLATIHLDQPKISLTFLSLSLSFV
jgi:hypothetical protein